jgi:hypothetical protein
MRALRWLLALRTALALVATATAAAQVSLLQVGMFVAPVYVAAPLGDTSRVFVVERGATVPLVREGVTEATPFLDIGPLSTARRAVVRVKVGPRTLRRLGRALRRPRRATTVPAK